MEIGKDISTKEAIKVAQRELKDSEEKEETLAKLKLKMKIKEKDHGN